ncbi:LysM peptidoglycan-binding domain-containing protein [Piscibacillus halophilus]|uniref:Stage VI sporulation protein D n=1 Tax=Piscibacillus halophilus TaxID=571933 RepID=A0A1H9BYQ3_9BACI|nr:LysM peptidoglycan-binding domain-containing protein [Piscibacillus halophilus]SEP93984.1 stage VI sporulation protein D [Piscibacillus halophilus]
MNQNGNEPFLFDLHEAIAFRQGEEIDDLYGISIQPDVNIIKESNYIQLRGVLMVSGDYQSLPREEPMFYMDNQEDEENYVQQVKALDNGFTTFQYPIPVDITIPASRVNQTGEPDVEIEYFDYELPEPKTLHVYAKIRLANVEVEDEYELEPQAEERNESNVNSDFQLQEIPSFNDHEEPEDTVDEVQSVEENENKESDSKGREFWQKKQSQSLNEFFNNKENKAKAKEKPEVAENKEKPENKQYENEKYENEYQADYENVEPVKEKKKEKKEEVEPVKEKEKEEVKPVEEKKEKKEKKEEVEPAKEEKKKEKKKDKKKEKPSSPEIVEQKSKKDYDENDGQDDYDDQDGSKKPKKKMFGLNYLSHFFRDGEEEQEKEKVSVKMRFVQENETLDSIADSYKVTVSQLERLNGLEENQEIKAGDVLYVPYNKS